MPWVTLKFGPRTKPDGRQDRGVRETRATDRAERLQYLTVLFEIPLGRGRLRVCDLDLEESVEVDPAARLLAINLLHAAADSSSTKTLPGVPSHQERLKGGLPSVRHR